MTATSDKNAGTGSTTATSSGTVTYRFIWTPSGPGDDMPSTVVLVERASASWQATDSRAQLPRTPPIPPSGSGSASIGSIPVTQTIPVTGNGIGVTKIGVRYKVYKPSNGYVEATGTLHATATVSVGSNFAAQCQSSCSYTAGVGTVRLQRDGANITDANRNVLPGQKVNLTVSGADANSTYQWQKPGKKSFKSYNTTAVNTQLDTNIVLSNSSLQYYYAYGEAAPDTIRCSVIVGGETATVEDDLVVEKIQYVFTSVPGHVVANSSVIVLAPTTATGMGISWEGSYAAPVHGTGKIGGFQFVTPQRFAKIEVSDSAEYKFIYNNSQHADGPQPAWEAPCPTPIPAATAGDSPQQPYRGRVEAPPPYGIYDADFKQVSIRGESFETYLMFLPTGSDSCWVPLSRITWSWSGTSAFDGTAFQLSGGSVPTPSNGGDITDHPTWTSVLDLRVVGSDVLWKL